MPLGPIKYEYDILVPESNFEWCEGPIKSLGVDLCHRTEDLLKLNYARSLGKIKTALQIWDKIYLTLYGKVTILNSFILSQLVYLMSVLPSPTEEFLIQIHRMIFNFLWSGKPDKIKRNVMILRKSQGGMLVPDISLKNKSLKAAWVQRMSKQEVKWKVFISSKIPINLDLFWKCNLNEYDATQLINNIPNRLVKEIIISWFEYSHHEPCNKISIHNQIIWFNSHVKVDNHTIFIKTLYDQDILYIHQFLDTNGEHLTLVQFEEKHNVHINMLDYYGIITAIPRQWRKKIREQGDTIEVNYTPNNALIALHQKHHVCKLIYSKFIENIHAASIPTGYRKWEAYLTEDLTLADWEQSFTRMYMHMKCSKYLAMQFKILHFILVTKEKLLQWGLAQDDICTFCEEEIETLPHIFVECEVTKLFWSTLYQ